MGHTHHDALHPAKADRFWHRVSARLPFCLLQPSLRPGLWQAIAVLQVRHWRAKAARVRLWDEGKAGEGGLQAAVPGGSVLAERTAGNSWILWLLSGLSWGCALSTAPVMAPRGRRQSDPPQTRCRDQQHGQGVPEMLWVQPSPLLP